MASLPPLALILVVALSLAGGELDVEWDLGGIALYAGPGVGVGAIILSRAPWLHAAVILGLGLGIVYLLASGPHVGWSLYLMAILAPVAAEPSSEHTGLDKWLRPSERMGQT